MAPAASAAMISEIGSICASPVSVDFSGSDVGVGDAPVPQSGGELALERQRLVVVLLEQGDEQGQQQEVMRAELEQRDVIMGRQGLPLGVGELQPGAALGLRAV